MRWFFSSLPVQATAVLALLFLVIQGTRSANSRNMLEAFENIPAPYELVVQMPFEPEAFHLTKLQSVARIVKVDGMSVHIRAVKPDQLRKLSRRPWIAALEPLAPQG